jgi:type IV secretory pathway protease TraF
VLPVVRQQVLIPLLAIVLPVAACIVARTGLLIVTVKGNSMVPTYRPGDRLLAVRRGLAPLRRGGVVVASLPENMVPGRRVVKRLAARGGEAAPNGTVVPTGHIFLLGDAHESTDSRHFGPVPARSVIGLVVLKLRPEPDRSWPGAGHPVIRKV